MQQPETVGPGASPGEEGPPLHGFRGGGGGDAARPAPLGPAIALSRQAGARGSSIARRVGRKLGWQVYDQDLLEYMAQDAVARQGLLDGLPRPAALWAEARLGQLLREQDLGQDPHLLSLARVMLALAAQGKVVLIGRGAGCVLPAETTVHVRVVAPRQDRVAYLGQWLRLTPEEAAEKVRARDEQREEFLLAHFRHRAAEADQYDLVLNSSRLGEDVCAELIAQAARARLGQPGG
jgi:cytidylate kinase